MTEPLIEKLASLERKMAGEKGAFALFAVFLRDEHVAIATTSSSAGQFVRNVWDVVVSAPWLSADKKSGYSYVTKKLNSGLTERELQRISRVVIVEPESLLVRTLHSAVKDIEHRPSEIPETITMELGVPFKRAFVVSSQAQAGRERSQRAVTR